MGIWKYIKNMFRDRTGEWEEIWLSRSADCFDLERRQRQLTNGTVKIIPGGKAIYNRQ
jgi:hypothetical protein|tara:strand:- start:3446 stop:3619 length:174 start_codon:yes stop_codon:yes gene_type:complete